MPAEIIPSRFCADYWGCFKVRASDNRHDYIITMDGSEGAPHCTCKGFEFSRDRTCKHIGLVFETGCFWNPQWHEGGPRIRKPFDYCRKPDEGLDPCPACGGPTIGVRIAV